MEIESRCQIEQISLTQISNLSQLSTSQLLFFLLEEFDEMEKRYRHPTDDDEKSTIFITTLMLRSKLWLFTNILIPKNVNLNKFTPNSKSQMELGHLLKDFQNLDLEEKRKIEHFTSLLYSTCKCKNKCHFKTDYDLAYSTYRSYSQKSHEEFNISVGALVKNARVSSNDKRNSGKRVTYEYKIGDTKICRDFFAVMHNVTERQIDRYQDCVKASKPFKDKRSGNNAISQTVYDKILKFLNQYLQSLVQKNHENFSAISTFQKICPHIMPGF